MTPITKKSCADRLKRIEGQKRELEDRVRELGQRIEDLDREIAAKDAVLAEKDQRIRDLRELKRAWVHIEGVRIAKVLSILSPSNADSDEGAQAFRFDGALGSDMMSPRWWSLAGW